MNNKILSGIIIGTILLSGCETKAETGALVGAGGGALAGGLITGSAGGALIGGAVGAAAGGLIGYALDRQDREIMQNRAPDTLDRIDRAQQLSVEDVKKMSSAGLRDEVIIDQIYATRSVFHLSAQDIVDLKRAGVSQKVIDAMVRTGG